MSLVCFGGPQILVHRFENSVFVFAGSPVLVHFEQLSNVLKERRATGKSARWWKVTWEACGKEVKL